MTFDKNDLSVQSKPLRKYVQTASGHLTQVKAAGTINISPNMQLSNCLYVPTLSHKLLSISHVTKELNCTMIMHPHFCYLQDIRTGEIIGRGTERSGLYYMDEISQSSKVMMTQGTDNHQAWLWHRRLGHPSIGYLRLLFPQIKQNLPCDYYVLAKSHRNSFSLNKTKSDSLFSLVHSDVWGPSPVIGGQNFKYFLLFVDDYTRMTWIYFLQQKSQVFEKFTHFYAMIQTQFKTNIQVLRSDNGGEFVNSQMKNFCQQKGMIHQTTCPYTPEQNGVAERKNRILLEMTRAMMIESQVPKTFWPEAVATSVYLLNRLPTKTLQLQTPLQKLSSLTKIPPTHSLQPRVFGCSVFVHIPKNDRTKLSPCAIKCVFVGYGMFQKGYRCYNPQTHQVITTTHCNFLETEYFYATHLRRQGENIAEDDDSLRWLSHPDNVNPRRDISFIENEPIVGTQDPVSPQPLIPEVTNSLRCIDPSNTISITSNTVDEGDTINEGEEEPEIHVEEQLDAQTRILPRRSNRGVPPKRYSPERIARWTPHAMGQVAQGRMTKSAAAYEIALYEEDIPNSVEEALQKHQWKTAMQKEMDALTRNHTWEKCELPEGKRPVGCRWVFTIKRQPDGSIERYKARLVAKGYTQTYGIDYSETFSPVAKINTVRVLLSVAANKEWDLHQFDVTNAFLHGELKQEVYMEAPEGFKNEFKKTEVCKLRRTLYGLKQSPRAWFGRFTKAMTQYGYQQSNSDHTLFLKKRGKLITCLIIYVDDMIITGDDLEEVKRLKENLFKEFEMKDLGRLKYFLGIEVLRSKKGIFINQKKYTLDLLTEIGMLDCKPADTPISVNHRLQIVNGADETDRGQYQHLVGKLIYLSHTRPDIAYAVSIVSQFMHQPQTKHLEAALRIVRYLKGTYNYGLLFKKTGNLEIQAYTDADWAGNPTDRRSTSGYFALVGGNLVSWKSKKQKVVSLSSAEAEFRGIKSGLTEVLWLRKLLSELNLHPTETCQLFCDNKAAISISENPVQHDRTKHVEVDRHFIKEKIEDKVVTLPFVRSEEQLADILTKAVDSRSFTKVLNKLNIGKPDT